MDFGKLNDISGVDFTLPPDAPETAESLAKASAIGPLSNAHHSTSNNLTSNNIYIGCTGWVMKEWVGKYYPLGTRPEKYLWQYARQFNTIEFNATHYAIPSPVTILGWRNAVPDGFKFAPKIPQKISHSRDLGISGGLIGQFQEAMLGLGDRLGVSFLQLPPYFGPERLPQLERFLKIFPLEQIPLAVEARHEDWYSNGYRGKKLFDMLAEYGVSSVITDVAGRRDVLHMRLSTGKVQLRFVGNDLHPTDLSRLEAWVDRLGAWLDRGLEEAYVFLHEPDNLRAPELAEHFVALANNRLGLHLQAPVRYDTTGQGSLF